MLRSKRLAVSVARTYHKWRAVEGCRGLRARRGLGVRTGLRVRRGLRLGAGLQLGVWKRGWEQGYS